MSLLHSLPSIKNSAKRRAGRGYGSQKGGHTAGRGMKGQNSRSGGKVPLWFEGGQLPLVRRLPWLRGKGRLKSLTQNHEVQLQTVIAHELKEVTPETLVQAGLISDTKHPVRLLGAQEVPFKMTVTGVTPTGPVRQAIEAAGGSITTA